MQIIYLYLFIAFMMSASTYGQSCTCACGSSAFSPTGKLFIQRAVALLYVIQDTALALALIPMVVVVARVPYYSTAIKCTCRCSNSYSAAPYYLGTADVNVCTTTSCKVACSTTYFSTCGVFNNQAYCSHAIRQLSATSITTTVFSFLTLYFSSKYFGQ